MPEVDKNSPRLVNFGARAKLPKKLDNPAEIAGLPLPDPYPEYVSCPHCGEPEVEVWCYQKSVRCHACGGLVENTPPGCFGSTNCLWRESA